MIAEKKAREEKSKSSSEKKQDTRTTAVSGVRRRALDELMEKEEALKDKRNRRDYWMTEGIEVKLINRKLPDDLRWRHATVLKMLDNYTVSVTNYSSTSFKFYAVLVYIIRQHIPPF